MGYKSLSSTVGYIHLDSGAAGKAVSSLTVWQVSLMGEYKIRRKHLISGWIFIHTLSVSL